MSIAWSYSFLMGICSLAFLPKTWIHLWKHSGTSFLSFASDFATLSSSSQIFHFSANPFTSIVFPLLDFFLFFFSFFCFFSSFFSFSFCFYQPDFPCFGLYYFLHSSEHLVIFTSPVF